MPDLLKQVLKCGILEPEPYAISCKSQQGSILIGVPVEPVLLDTELVQRNFELGLSNDHLFCWKELAVSGGHMLLDESQKGPLDFLEEHGRSDSILR